MKKMTIILLSAIFMMYGCEKNPTDSGDSIIELSDNEKMAIIAAEVSHDNGGMMADLEMATATAATGQPGSLLKPSGYDTTFTTNWITYSLSLAFYTADGREQAMYVDNLTDRLVYASSLSGTYDAEGARQSIELRKGSSLDISGITTDNLHYTGTSSNNSSYIFNGLRNDLMVEVESVYSVTDLVLNKNAASYIPLSGKLECSFKGVYSRDGVIKDKSVEYSFSTSIEFNGGNQAIVVLPSGNKFTLDLVTGDYSEND